MGLDTYGLYPQGHPKNDTDSAMSIPDSLFVTNKLCGGMLSGGGNSFRGKVYSGYVEWATAQTLYQDIIQPHQVTSMANALEGAVNRFNSYRRETFDSSITKEEAEQLAEWFRVVSDNNGIVVGWW